MRQHISPSIVGRTVLSSPEDSSWARQMNLKLNVWKLQPFEDEQNENLFLSLQTVVTSKRVHFRFIGRAQDESSGELRIVLAIIAREI